MSLYVFNNQQKVTKVIKYKRLVEATQEIELNGTDELTVEIPNKDWNKLEEEPLYLAVRDTSKRFSFHMYKILQEDTQDDTVTVKGIQIGYDEMKAYGYIKDRRFTQASMQSVANVIVEGTDWQTGFVDSDLPAITTNFYYISRLEAIRKVIEANGCEIRFRVEITGNKIVAKRIDFLKRMSSDKGKRFSYGSKLLSVVKEKDSAELYTALVGRGKGEEVGDGYGRRIGFEDVEWNVANGDPVDKPLGQEFVELPDMTALYGYPDGEPRTNVVTFEDTEDEALLLEQTYEKLVEVSRPQVQFKATVQLIGDAELGETVSIIRHDLNFKYKTRIFKVKRDLLNNNRTEIELGDRITESLGRTIRRIDTTNQRREERIVEYVQNTADGKNKIFRQASTPDTGMTVNDLWYKPVGEGETELYRWNGNIWQLEKVSAGLLGGTLDAENGDVNLINVNVASIVGETSSFVQSWWNGINSSVQVNPNGIEMMGSATWRRNIMNATGVELFNGSGGYNLAGTIGYFKGRTTDAIGDESVIDTGTPRHYIGITANSTHDVAIGYNSSSNANRNYNSALRVSGSNGSIYFDKQMFVTGTGNHLHFQGNQIRQVSQIRMSGPNSDSVAGVYNDGANDDIWVQGWGGVKIGDRRPTDGGYQNHLHVTNASINAYVPLNMHNNPIWNDSDIRLKTNVSDSEFDALKEINRLRFIDFSWDETHPRNKGKSRSRQFGIVAQYSPFLQAIPDDEDSYLKVDLSKQVNLNSKAAQELLNYARKLEERIEVLENERTGSK